MITVQDLINDLKRHDPNTPVLFSCSLESGRSFSHCLYDGDVTIEVAEPEEILETSEELDEPLDEEFLESVKEHKNIVVVNVIGNCNYEE